MMKVDRAYVERDEMKLLDAGQEDVSLNGYSKNQSRLMGKRKFLYEPKMRRLSASIRVMLYMKQIGKKKIPHQ